MHERLNAANGTEPVLERSEGGTSHGRKHMGGAGISAFEQFCGILRWCGLKIMFYYGRRIPAVTYILTFYL